MLDKDIDICISFSVLWSCVQSYFHFKSMAGYLVLKRALSISDPFSGWKKNLAHFWDTVAQLRVETHILSCESFTAKSQCEAKPVHYQRLLSPRKYKNQSEP